MELIILLPLLALVLFVLASFGVPAGRVQLGWAGLACLSLYWVLLHGGT